MRRSMKNTFLLFNELMRFKIQARYPEDKEVLLKTLGYKNSQDNLLKRHSGAKPQLTVYR